MVNSKKVATTLPLPKKKGEKLPLVEELCVGNKGKGKVKVCSVEIVLVEFTTFLLGVKCQRGWKSSCQQERKVWPSISCGKVFYALKINLKTQSKMDVAQWDKHWIRIELGGI